MAQLRTELSASTIEAIRQRNRAVSPGCCATHDFCDANVVMGADFERCLRREITMDDSPLAETERGLRIAAWEIATREHLTAKVR